MSSAAVADDRDAGRKPKAKGKKKAKADAVDYSTFRIYGEDGEDLSDLASMLGKTIADVYRQLCAPLIRQARVREIESKLKRLKPPE